MLISLQALLPIFLVILCGGGLKKLNFLSVNFWLELEKLVYFFFFPLMLAGRIAQAEFSGLALANIFLALILLLAVMTGLLILLKPLISRSGAEFTSVYQGGIRFNSYVVIAVVGEIFGAYGIAVAAIIMALLIPLLNVLCVFIFALYAQSTSAGWRGILINIGKNPLIVGCMLGVLLNVSGIGLPSITAPLVEILSRAALPLGLLTVGAGLSLASLRAAGRPLLASSLLKLLIMPLLAWGIGWAVGLSSADQQVLFLFAAMPTATSTYILARQLGGDADLMAAIITAQTLLAMLSLPILLALQGYFI